MSTNSLSPPSGHVFEPALQDISLKRFRLRYCTWDDCYYLHWENPVCRALAKYYGLDEGIHRSSGIQRYEVEGDKQLSYLGCTKEANQATLEWVMDFSGCGLVIHQLAVKARCYYDNPESISFTVRGDNSISVSPQLGDQHVNLNCLSGCSRISLTLSINSSSGESVRLLPTLEDDEESPLDVIVELMCPRKDDDIYAGELLLGMKYSSGDQPINQTEVESLSNTSLASEGVEGAGHLQVHIVEGAGIVDEETHKPFNTICKCELLPSTSRHSHKHTSPRHNAYPTWTKQFDFEGLSKQDILSGGLEVILYDHHKFTSDSNIGGLRMCLPRKKHSSLLNDSSPLSSPSVSRGSSPAPLDNGDYNSDGSMSPLSVFTSDAIPLDSSPKSSITLPRTVSSTSRRSLPNSASMQTVSHTHLSPEVLRRAPSPDVKSSSTLSPSIIRRSNSSTAAKNKFRLSGSHLLNFLSPASSPHSSPGSIRKIFSRHNSVESDYIHWWMEDTPTLEVQHWKRMIEKDGEWVYFWHLIRPKLKSAC